MTRPTWRDVCVLYGGAVSLGVVIGLLGAPTAAGVAAGVAWALGWLWRNRP